MDPIAPRDKRQRSEGQVVEGAEWGKQEVGGKQDRW